MLVDYPDVRINIPPLSVMKDEISVAGEKNGVLAVVEKAFLIFNSQLIHQ